ncbi:MAG: hypothetical protein U1F15_14635 [Burkholderiales bacterium]
MANRPFQRLLSRIPVLRYIAGENRPAELPQAPVEAIAASRPARPHPEPAASAVDGASIVRSLQAELAQAARATDVRLRKLEASIGAAGAEDAIRLLDYELERNPRFADPRRLLRHGAQVCSQNGEDGMIGEIFRRIGTSTRVFAEVGVGDGNEGNTSFLLSQGWTGYWLDGDDAFLKTLRTRPDLAGCVKTVVSHITRENVAALFARAGVPAEFDFLSVDIDHNTYYAWEGLRDYRPRVVVVEYNATIPPDVDWKVRYDPARTWDGTNNFGASLKAYEVLGRRLGYALVGCDFIGVNAFFVRDDLVADQFAAPFTAENHYEPPRYQLATRRGHARAILDRAGPE